MNPPTDAQITFVQDFGRETKSNVVEHVEDRRRYLPAYIAKLVEAYYIRPSQRLIMQLHREQGHEAREFSAALGGETPTKDTATAGSGMSRCTLRRKRSRHMEKCPEGWARHSGFSPPPAKERENVAGSFSDVLSAPWSLDQLSPEIGKVTGNIAHFIRLPVDYRLMAHRKLSRVPHTPLLAACIAVILQELLWQTQRIRICVETLSVWYGVAVNQKSWHLKAFWVRGKEMIQQLWLTAIAEAGHAPTHVLHDTFCHYPDAATMRMFEQNTTTPSVAGDVITALCLPRGYHTETPVVRRRVEPFAKRMLVSTCSPPESPSNLREPSTGALPPLGPPYDHQFHEVWLNFFRHMTHLAADAQAGYALLFLNDSVVAKEHLRQKCDEEAANLLAEAWTEAKQLVEELFQPDGARSGLAVASPRDTVTILSAPAVDIGAVCVFVVLRHLCRNHFSSVILSVDSCRAAAQLFHQLFEALIFTVKYRLVNASDIALLDVVTATHHRGESGQRTSHAPPLERLEMLTPVERMFHCCLEDTRSKPSKNGSTVFCDDRTEWNLHVAQQRPRLSARCVRTHLMWVDPQTVQLFISTLQAYDFVRLSRGETGETAPCNVDKDEKYSVLTADMQFCGEWETIDIGDIESSLQLRRNAMELIADAVIVRDASVERAKLSVLL